MEHQVKQSECVCMNMKRMVQPKLAFNIIWSTFSGDWPWSNPCLNGTSKPSQPIQKDLNMAVRQGLIVNTTLGWFSSFSENCQFWVLECFERLNPVFFYDLFSSFKDLGSRVSKICKN
jgi:hypothetical protein